MPEPPGPPLVIYGVDRHPGLGRQVRARLPATEVREYRSTDPLSVASSAEIIVTRPGDFIEDLFGVAHRLRWPATRWR